MAKLDKAKFNQTIVDLAKKYDSEVHNSKNGSSAQQQPSNNSNKTGTHGSEQLFGGKTVEQWNEYYEKTGGYD